MMIRPTTSRENVEEIIQDILESDFYPEIRRELEIEELGYEIRTHPVRLIEGYPDSSIKASAVLNSDETEIEIVAFFTQSISDEINSGFSRIIMSNMFFEIARVYTKFVLIHELVHVQQIKNGMSMDEYRRTEYEDSEFERAANQKAIEVLGREGELQREVAQMITNKSGIIDNTMAEEFISKFISYFK